MKIILDDRYMDLPARTLLTYKEVARWTGRTECMVRVWVRNGKITPFTEHDPRMYIEKGEVMRFVEARGDR